MTCIERLQHDDLKSSQVRRTSAHPFLMCGRNGKMCTDIFFEKCPLSFLQVSFTTDNDPLYPTGCKHICAF